MSERKSIHGEWSSGWAFFLAATGAAVGLGNIWMFPYLAMRYGGGAFIIVYLICVALVAMPLLVTEIMLGRRGRKSPANTFYELALDEGRSSAWAGAGFVAMTGGLIVAAFFSLVAAWSLEYLWRSILSGYVGITSEQAGSAFLAMLGDPWLQMFWYSIFLAVATGIVARGVRKGLEPAARFMVPMLFALLLILIIYAFWVGQPEPALRYLFVPDFSRLNASAVLLALTYSFFGLSVGVGAMLNYGAYMPNHLPIMPMTAVVVFVDFLVAVSSGLAIYPLLMADGLPFSEGPTLVFAVLPAAFGSMPYGSFYAALFYLMLVLAAWTSVIALLEPTVSWLVECGWRRFGAAILVAMIVWVIAMALDFSFNLWSSITWHDMSVFDIFNAASSDIILPLSGFLAVFFAAWMVSERSLRQELRTHRLLVRLWLIVLRYIAPVGILFVLFNALGLMRGVL